MLEKVLSVYPKIETKLYEIVFHPKYSQYVGKKFIRKKTATKAERTGIITGIVKDEKNTLYFVVLWDCDIDPALVNLPTNSMNIDIIKDKNFFDETVKDCLLLCAIPLLEKQDSGNYWKIG